MEVLCAYGMRSRIWKESKFATHRRSDWRIICGQTGVGNRRQELISAVRLEIQSRSDRRQPGGQTGRTTSVRPRSVEFEGNFYFR
ncbi:unknown protein [Oryza sativa Japonica Group]|uniref:Uncharacterized protein n=2 Tax=Oryza sativa subsp. japonica TaxID=39947 RepID=Q7F053_ORYSJ|nr:unknown protein [Oryza sativa Japonica Group]BAC10898.1 unknown protein [Oryza sativa Japonica Group]